MTSKNEAAILPLRISRIAAPLRACICGAKAFALGVALGIATGLGHHHCQVASVLERVTHSLLKKRGMQPTAPEFWNRSAAAEQSNAIMNAQHAGGARFPAVFGKKAHTMLACCRYGTKI
jgi:hypothetical protein